ncbi:hypothetical protein BN8_06187 [Fibrisoma limi BUZ 3]|uniref:TonB-dependent receptor plug domain-containing protein n=1 Tax=Fibrisoma limi BUZ 3 TaxID=1185876 RepID=I2GSC2_9BACT|nr:hypothetical protein [Fibrisoma limi]CCH56801.1 hypothetical protein BN8_06187 [Fibrisoma limi BUZ 3]
MKLSLRSFRVLLALLVLSGTSFGYSAADAVSRSDTTKPNRTRTRSAYERPAPMIMPGMSLDSNFRSLPKQDPAVQRVVPAWLKAKTTGKPTYVVNGKVATVTQLRGLQQQQVVSIKILPGEDALKLYGGNARQGIVLITTQAGLEPNR